MERKYALQSYLYLERVAVKAITRSSVRVWGHGETRAQSALAAADYLMLPASQLCCHLLFVLLQQRLRFTHCLLLLGQLATHEFGGGGKVFVIRKVRAPNKCGFPLLRKGFGSSAHLHLLLQLHAAVFLLQCLELHTMLLRLPLLRNGINKILDRCFAKLNV